MDENPLKDGPNFSFTICYIAKQTNKQKYNGPWAVIDYEQSLFFLSPYRERYARDTQMTTHSTEGASFLASARRLRARAIPRTLGLSRLAKTERP